MILIRERARRETKSARAKRDEDSNNRDGIEAHLADSLSSSGNSVLLLLVSVLSRSSSDGVVELNLDAEIVSKLVDGGSRRSNEVSDVSSVDGELDDLQGEARTKRRRVSFERKREEANTHVSVDDEIVLSVVNDLQDLLLDPIDIGSRSSDGDGIGVRARGIVLSSSNSNGDELVLSDDAAQIRPNPTVSSSFFTLLWQVGY